MQVTGWHGLFPSPTGIEDRSREETLQFPSWEGLGVGSFPRFHEDKGREISVNPVRKCGRGFKPLPHCIFSNAALSDGDSFLTG